MSLTPSNMVELGQDAPPFSLPDTDEKLVSLEDFTDSKALLVMFICNHCPYVVHVQDELAAVGRDYLGRGVAIVAINSNDVSMYPEDSPKNMKKLAKRVGYPFPYLFDETQEVARAYGAACTPDFFLYDSEQCLVYRGQLDDSRPGSGVQATGADLRAAIDAVLECRSPSGEQTPSSGCNIKWK